MTCASGGLELADDRTWGREGMLKVMVFEDKGKQTEL